MDGSGGEVERREGEGGRGRGEETEGGGSESTTEHIDVGRVGNGDGTGRRRDGSDDSEICGEGTLRRSEGKEEKKGEE